MDCCVEKKLKKYKSTPAVKKINVLVFQTNKHSFFLFLFSMANKAKSQLIYRS